MVCIGFSYLIKAPKMKETALAHPNSGHSIICTFLLPLLAPELTCYSDEVLVRYPVLNFHNLIQQCPFHNLTIA